jgi:hypothetical protein
MAMVGFGIPIAAPLESIIVPFNFPVVRLSDDWMADVDRVILAASIKITARGFFINFITYSSCYFLRFNIKLPNLIPQG